MFSIILSDGRCLGRRASDASHTAASSDASSDASASADVVSFVPTFEDRARMEAATIAYRTDPEFEIVSVVSGIKFTQAELPFFDPNEVVPRFPSNTHSRYRRQPLNWEAVNILLQSAKIPQPLSQRLPQFPWHPQLSRHHHARWWAYSSNPWTPSSLHASLVLYSNTSLRVAFDSRRRLDGEALCNLSFWRSKGSGGPWGLVFN